MSIHEHLAAKTLAAAALSSNASKNLEDNVDPRLPAELKARLPEANEHAHRQMQSVSANLARQKTHVEHELNALLRSRRNFDARYDAFLAVTEQVASVVSPKAACRRGCSHCCHIPVAVTGPEAEAIGKRIGIRPQSPDYVQRPSERGYGYDKPCTFLVKGECSIYAHRPVACRVHFNMDRDDLLCRLLPELSVPVPLADMRSLQKAYILLCEGSDIADIREFFPQGKRR